MHEEKKVGEKKKLPFSIFAKKTKWGFACQDVLYNNINVVHIAAKITKWPQANISIKSNYPSLFFWQVIFFFALLSLKRYLCILELIFEQDGIIR